MRNEQQAVEKLTQENQSLKNTLADLQKRSSSDVTAPIDTVTTKIVTSQTEYTVKKDDNLWIIAQKFYGDGFKFKQIADDNNIKRPYVVLIGTKLTINQ